jgi:tetratricopeptide (TPR) repeat protein
MGFMLTSCGGGSSELSTAKSSIKKAEDTKNKLLILKDKAAIDKANAEIATYYRTAKTNLDIEVAKGSSSANLGEAWFLLGKSAKELKLSDSSIFAFKQADKFLGKEKKDEVQMRSELGSYLFEIWVDNINKAVENYNAALGEETNQAERAQKFQAVLKNVQACLDAKPENIDIVYTLRGGSYYQLGDTNKSMAAFEEYLELNKPMLSALTAKGVTYKEPRVDVLKKLGTPAEAKSVPMPDKLNPNPEITILYDKYTNLVPGKDMFIFYPKDKEKGEFLLNGFSTPPASWFPQERERDISFEFTPFVSLAYHYYTNKNWDKAIEYAKLGLAFKPADENLSNLLPTIYTESGKTDLALAEFKAMTEKNPNDKNALAQYGSMLANIDRYDEAIVQYEKALKLDPQFDVVLFNLAAAYKNKAGVIQKEEQKKADDAEAARKKDKKAQPYTIDVNKYKPALVKSAECFERYRKLPGKDRDKNAWAVVDQLLNIYDVLDDKDNYKKMASEFIGLEYANTENPRYYEALAKVYGKQKSSTANAKLKEALEKADALRKAGKN